MWLLPSRSRPLSLKRFFTHYALTEADSEGVVWLDMDDADKYDSVPIPKKWTVVISPRLDGTGAITNEFFKMFPDEPWYGLLADDVLPKTYGWDKKLIEAAGSDGLAYGDDGIHGNGHSAHPCVGGDRIRELGWLALPGCKRIYIDNALFDDAVMRGAAIYLPDVIMEHLHFSNGKSPMDATYEKSYNASDRQVYETWRASL